MYGPNIEPYVHPFGGPAIVDIDSSSGATNHCLHDPYAHVVVRPLSWHLGGT